MTKAEWNDHVAMVQDGNDVSFDREGSGFATFSDYDLVLIMQKTVPLITAIMECD